MDYFKKAPPMVHVPGTEILVTATDKPDQVQVSILTKAHGEVFINMSLDELDSLGWKGRRRHAFTILSGICIFLIIALFFSAYGMGTRP